MSLREMWEAVLGVTNDTKLFCFVYQVNRADPKLRAAKKPSGDADNFEDVMKNVIAIRFDAMNDSDSDDSESVSAFGGNSSSDGWSSD